PIDVLSREIPGPFARVALPADAAEPDADALTEAARLLSSAAAPAILVGGGARTAEIARLAEALDAPVVTTGNAAGVLAPE
ncbi:thiamine pyrophosphate-binding protein, partial [Acinetobacter baumannii]